MAYNDTIRSTANAGSTRGDSTRRVLSAGTLTGDRVRNRAGEDLGSVEEIMLDLQSGRVAYVVLSFGGFLGIGDKLFAVPWESLVLNTADHEFMLDVDKQTLENAPGFDKENWPDMADPNWGSQIHSHYGREPYWNRADEWRRSPDLERDLPASGASESATGRARTYSAGTDTGERRNV
jgi:sporulation protein YlmC with PRC-barrel domain